MSDLNELVRIEEEHGEDDEAGIEPGFKVSHKGQKKQIFHKLDDMANNMRSFTTDIESRLDKIYKQGASKKFGFDEIVEGSTKIISGDTKPTESDKAIEKMAN